MWGSKGTPGGIGTGERGGSGTSPSLGVSLPHCTLQINLSLPHQTAQGPRSLDREPCPSAAPCPSPSCP